MGRSSDGTGAVQERAGRPGADQVDEAGSDATAESLRGRAGALVTYGATVTALATAARLVRGEMPAGLSWRELAVGSVATFKVSRLLAKGAVTAPLRAPFARPGELTGPAEVSDHPRDGHLRHTLGELVTCPFCLAQWIATGFVAGFAVAPRSTRLVADAFAMVAASDFLQFAYAGAEQATGR